MTESHQGTRRRGSRTAVPFQRGGNGHCRPGARLAEALACVGLGLLLLAGPTAAQESTPAAGDGWGDSYWGPIPPPHPEVTARYHTARRSAWEWPLYGTYRAVGFPLQLTTLGIKSTVIALDESGAMDRLVSLFGAYDLPYGFRAAVDIGSTAGGTYGMTFYHEELFGDRAELQVKGKTGPRGRSQVTGGILFPHEDAPRFLDLGLGYTKREDARYFGIGPFTDDADESEFTREMTWLGATYRHGLGRGFAVEGMGLYSLLRNRGPREDDEPLEEVFAGDLPFGVGIDSDGADLAVTLLHEDTRTDGRPNRGGVRRFKVGRYLPAVSEDNPFTSFRADVTQFLGLWYGRGLALRGVWTWIDAGDDPVHFQRLFAFDRPDEVRGFARSRFRGHGLTFFSAEYRFPTWSYRDTEGIGIDTYFFFDWGQVFDTKEQIALRNFREGYGGGLRWISRDGFGGSFEVAFSEEEVILRLRTDQNFQYAKHGFYHGRIPVPLY